MRNSCLRVKQKPNLKRLSAVVAVDAETEIVAVAAEAVNVVMVVVAVGVLAPPAIPWPPRTALAA